jgi:hypothetical protein
MRLRFHSREAHAPGPAIASGRGLPARPRTAAAAGDTQPRRRVVAVARRLIFTLFLGIGDEFTPDNYMNQAAVAFM